VMSGSGDVALRYLAVTKRKKCTAALAGNFRLIVFQTKKRPQRALFSSGGDGGIVRSIHGPTAACFALRNQPSAGLIRTRESSEPFEASH
jgi:hypothetical protein